MEKAARSPARTALWTFVVTAAGLLAFDVMVLTLPLPHRLVGSYAIVNLVAGRILFAEPPNLPVPWNYLLYWGLTAAFWGAIAGAIAWLVAWSRMRLHLGTLLILLAVMPPLIGLAYVHRDWLMDVIVDEWLMKGIP